MNAPQFNQHEALRLWLRLLGCSQLIEGQIRSKIRSEFASTLPRFDLMSQLYREPKGLKMSELGKRLLVTSGNITAIVDQLEGEGLVQRQADAQDRRAFLIVLSKKGRSSFEKMARQHEQWIQQLFSGFNRDAQVKLYDMLGHLKHSIENPQTT